MPRRRGKWLGTVLVSKTVLTRLKSSQPQTETKSLVHSSGQLLAADPLVPPVLLDLQLPSAMAGAFRHQVIRKGSSTRQRRSRFGKRFFRVTALATLISNPGRRDLRRAVNGFVLQLRDLGWCGRFAHDGVAGGTLLHHNTSDG
jgi:hypothetical protein